VGERGDLRRACDFLIWVLVMETVLIVEDDTETRDTLTALLEKDGREIVTAGDGQEAFEWLSNVPRPCLILLDLVMPRMDGGEFLGRFKQTAEKFHRISSNFLFGRGFHHFRASQFSTHSKARFMGDAASTHEIFHPLVRQEPSL